MIINVYWSWRELSVILVRFLGKLNFLNRVSNNIQITNFMKIRRRGAELIHADGGADGQDEANSRFSEF